MMNKWEPNWKTVLAILPMSNGGAERVVWTIKRSLKKMVTGDDRDWEKSHPDVLFGYRCHRLGSEASEYEHHYGVKALMTSVEMFQIGECSEESFDYKLMEISSMRTKKMDVQNNSVNDCKHVVVYNMDDMKTLHFGSWKWQFYTK